MTAGDHTEGASFFNDTQVTTSLVDNKAFFEVATPVVDQTVSPPFENRLDFTLPFTPTTGNGRSTPLSQDLFQNVTNGRIDLPTFRPDLIQAFWGFSVEDAQNRGEVEVTKVDGSVISLRNPVPVGATVYATFYYNLLTDSTFTVTSEVAGGSGVGRYSIFDSNEDPVHVIKFGTKSAGLGSIVVQFPSGSELKPDARFEGGAQLEETVTVTFEETDATLAKFTTLGSDPYFTIQDASDHARFTVDGSALAGGTVGIDLSRHLGVEGLGFPASFLGDEVVYDEDTGLLTYAVDSGVNDEIAVSFDGVLVTGTAVASAATTALTYANALNSAARFTTANGPEYSATTRFLGNTVITAAEYDELEFSYTGESTGPSGLLTASIAPATYGSPAALATAVESAITAATGAIAGLSITVAANADGQLLFKMESAADDDEFIQSEATITCAFASVSAGSIITIGGVVLTSVNGARTPGSDDFQVDGGVSSDSTLATELAAAINDPLNSFTGIVTAADLAAVVTLTAVPLGTLGDLVTLTTDNGPAYTLSGALLTGGEDNGGGFMEFVTHGTPASDFAVMAGIQTDSIGGAQMKMLQTDVARRFSVAGASGRLIYDRVILRGRLVPGGGSMTPHHIESQAGILVEGSNGAEQAGLPPQSTGQAGQRAVVQPASIAGSIAVSGNQVPAATFGDLRDGQTSVTFFADGGIQPQNNIFRVTVDGVAVTVVFADATGTAIPAAGSADVPLGPASSADTILDQIGDAFVAAGLLASQVVQEGSGIRILSALSSSDSSVVIGDGSANADVGFSQGASSDRLPVEAGKVASALMAHAKATAATFYLEYSSPTATFFAEQALAGVIRDEANAEFLYLQSQANTGGGLGSSSNITWEEPSAGNGSVLLPGTGLLNEAGDGAAGEDGISGFHVTSTDPEGSGSADDSVLNSGTGQDGNVGQTYRDSVSGLSFVVLERDGGGNYPAGESFTYEVRKVVATDANIPITSIPGAEVIVANTFNVPPGDTALVETFRKDGLEPRVGDQYFITYNFTKTNFNVKFFTRTNAIEAEFGLATPDNPLALGGSLAKQNGSLVVGFKQVLRDEGEVTASIGKFAVAVEELEGTLPGGASPDVLTPLPVGSTPTELQALLVQMGQHADIQSSIRFRSERSIVSGMGAGFQPSDVSTIAQAIQRERVRVFYPDIVQITFTDAFGNEASTFIDGYYIAAGWLGFLTGTDTDVATPWTAKRITGFDRLGRNLTEVDKNTIAVTGVTVVEDRPASLRIRQGLTTDMRDVLRRTPTIITIADEVQERSRTALDRFIGLKFLAGILIQVEGAQTDVLKGLVLGEILTAYAGVRAQTAPDNPTVAEVSAFYRPVFPLLFLVLTFGLRSSL